MPFAVFKGEKNINELAARLYRIQGPASSPAVDKAAAALLQANPNLKDLGSVSAGSVIVVPEASQPVNPGAMAAPASILASSKAPPVGGRLDAARSSLAASLSDTQSRSNDTLALLQKPEIQAAANADRALAQRLQAMAQDAKAALQDIQSKQAMVQQAIDRMKQDLAKFPRDPA